MLKKALDAFSATTANGICPEKLLEEMKNAFNARLVRLTSTDNQHTKALIEEIRLRLVKPSLYRLLASVGDEEGRTKSKKDPTNNKEDICKSKEDINTSKEDLGKNYEDLCKSTIVIVAEADSTYARAFRDEFRTQLRGKCKETEVQLVSYLQGLDGAFPRGGGTPQAAAPAPANGKRPRNEKWLEQATLEQADGPSQYDYLRRLATHIEGLDRAERKAGRHGVRAIGILGNDTYDKILVLDVLRDRFPSAVFFAADLDARLLAAGANRSTRNLVVASGFGFKLRRGLQGRAPPFRDTYQTGIFLAVQVALDQDVYKQQHNTQAFKCWFAQPRLFEIGRTRPVNLIPAGLTKAEQDCIKCSHVDFHEKSTGGAVKPVPAGQTKNEPKCDRRNSAGGNDKCRPIPGNYPNGIHDDTDWRPFFPLPSFFSVMIFIGMALAAAALAFLLSKRARSALISVHDAWVDRTPVEKCALVVLIALVLAALPALFFIFIYYPISQDVRSLKGEPFAWLEGVSIWPTQIIRLIILFSTVALLIYGRARLRWDIDGFAKRFQLAPLTGQAKAGLLERLNPKWLWWLDAQKPQTDKEALVTRSVGSAVCSN